MKCRSESWNRWQVSGLRICYQGTLKGKKGVTKCLLDVRISLSVVEMKPAGHRNLVQAATAAGTVRWRNSCRHRQLACLLALSMSTQLFLSLRQTHNARSILRKTYSTAKGMLLCADKPKSPTIDRSIGFPKKIKSFESRRTITWIHCQAGKSLWTEHRRSISLVAKRNSRFDKCQSSSWPRSPCSTTELERSTCI